MFIIIGIINIMGNKPVNFDGKIIGIQIETYANRRNKYISISPMPNNYKTVILLRSNSKFNSLSKFMKIDKLCRFYCFEYEYDNKILIIDYVTDCNYFELNGTIYQFCKFSKADSGNTFTTILYNNHIMLGVTKDIKCKMELNVMYNFKYAINEIGRYMIIDYKKIEYDEYDEDYYNPNNVEYVNGYMKLK